MFKTFVEHHVVAEEMLKNLGNINTMHFCVDNIGTLIVYVWWQKLDLFTDTVFMALLDL